MQTLTFIVLGVIALFLIIGYLSYKEDYTNTRLHTRTSRNICNTIIDIKYKLEYKASIFGISYYTSFVYERASNYDDDSVSVF